MIIIVRLALNLGSSCNFQVSIGFMDNIIEEVTGSEYKYGFVTNVETDTIGKGLNEEVIRIISAKKEEPDWMLEFRLKAYRHWLTMKMPRWAQLDIPEINYHDKARQSLNISVLNRDDFLPLLKKNRRSLRVQPAYL